MLNLILQNPGNLKIEIQGKKRNAKIFHKAVYDPENKKLMSITESI